MASQTNRKKYGCPICEVEFGDIRNWETHIAGKKHQYNQNRVELIQKREANGLYITGFPYKVATESLRVFFVQFGEMLDFYHNVEKHFVLTTYKEKSVADNLLNSERGIFYNGRRLKIVKRRPHPQTILQTFAAGSSTAQISSDPKDLAISHNRVTSILTSGGSLKDLLYELVASPVEKEMHQKVLYDLKDLFQKRFKCNVHAFGSTRTGLNIRGSDIDVYVEILEQLGGGMSGLPQPEKLVRIGQKLMLHGNGCFHSVRAITRAKTPIIKCMHRPSKVNCDVSFKNKLGVANSELIRHYLSLDFRVFPYFMIIRYWALRQGFSGCGKMSNYALATIGAFYLQQLDPPVLPTVYHLQQLCKEETRVDGWLCSFSNDPTAVEPSENKSSLFELLAGFFSFFRDFDISESVICPLTAKTIPKVLFLQPENLPEPMKTGYMNVPSDKLGLRVSSDMVVQDPFELTHNLTASMGGKALKSFLANCNLAAAIFEEVLKEPEEKKLPRLNDLFNIKPTGPLKAKEVYSCISSAEMYMTYSADETLSVGYLISNPDEEGSVELSPGVIFERWVGLVYKLLLEFFNKNMKFHITEESKEHMTSKVQKVNEPSDVHGPLHSNTNLEKRVLHCKGHRNLWEGRRKVQKTLKFPPNMSCFKMEEMISEVMFSSLPQDESTTEPLVMFSCEFQPVKEPPSVNFVFKDTGCQNKIFMNIMMFLRTRIPSLLTRYMKHLKHQTRNSCPMKDSDVDDAGHQDAGSTSGNNTNNDSNMNDK